MSYHMLSRQDNVLVCKGGSRTYTPRRRNIENTCELLVRVIFVPTFARIRTTPMWTCSRPIKYTYQRLIDYQLNNYIVKVSMKSQLNNLPQCLHERIK